MNRAKKISVCVPALNEEKNIAGAVKDLITALFPHLPFLEVIIVDDGSRDATPGIIRQLSGQYPQIKIISHLRTKGIGVCYRDALKVAAGEWFTWFPADHENSAQELLACIGFADENTIVISHHVGIDSRPFIRRVLSRIYTFAVNRYFGLSIKYYNGLTVFPVSLLHSFSLVSDGFCFSAESIVKAVKKESRVIELSAPLRGRECGKSKALSLSSCIQIAKDAWSLIFQS